MYLLAISGGPDSMFLLHQYRKRNIVVAHVNYHKRVDSNVDQEIVESFCQKHHIPYEILDVKEIPKGNFQSWARKIRYDFFKIIYEKYNCKKLLMAHHKDDFIETALMQQRSGRTPRYFGIKEKNIINDMNIYRPLLDLYFKSEILEDCERYDIKYAIDSSNAQDDYERNRIRHELDGKTKAEKQSIYKWFTMSNKILKKKFAKVDHLYNMWEKKEFNTSFFNHFSKYQHEIIYSYIHNQIKDEVKISQNKIEGLIAFINGQEGGKEFVINKNWAIKKEHKKLLVIKK